MLLITNGKLIVNPAMHIDELEEAIKVITENAKNDGIKKPLFKKIDIPFVCFENKSEIDFFKLKQYCPEYVDLQFKAIGKESVTLPITKMKEIKHVYSPEELDKIAEGFAQKQQEKENLEDEKKQVNKQFADNITIHETEISELANKYRLRYEIQSKTCRVILDFKEGNKYFIDPNTNELLHTEKLTPEDQRSLFDLEGFTPDTWQDEEKAAEIGDALSNNGDVKTDDPETDSSPI